STSTGQQASAASTGEVSNSSQAASSTIQSRMLCIGQSQYQTCLARLQGQVARVGFDSCGGHSFMTTKSAQRLGLKIYEAPALGIMRHADKTISSINNRITTLTLSSLDRKFNLTVNVRVLVDLGEVRWRTLSPDTLKIAKSKGVDLVDDDSKPVDIIFGLPYYVRLVVGKEVKITDDLL